MELNKIYEGWKNHLFPDKDLKDIIDIVSTERLKVCEGCEWHSKNHSTPWRPDEHCTHCGCTLASKTKCLTCECPLKKWLAEQQEDE